MNGFDAYTLKNIAVPLSLPRFGGRHGVTPFVEFWERKIGHYPLAVLSVLDDHLVGLLQYVFHCLEKQPLPSYVLCFCIFGVDREKALRLALRLGHYPRLVGLGVRDYLRGIAAGLAEDLVAILLCFADELVLVLLGPLNLFE